jgi:small subunit ribosomal protein S7
MPRRGPAPRRDLMPDPVYRSVLVTQVINKVLQRGKKSIAEKIVYDALVIVAEKTASSDKPGDNKPGDKTGDKPGEKSADKPAEKTGGDALAVVKRAIDNIKPQLEVKSRRVGGATYQVPVEVRPRRATTLAIRWLVGFARDRRERTMAERLAAELLDANNGIGSAVKRKDDMHKMAESNKAFAHYRW